MICVGNGLQPFRGVESALIDLIIRRNKTTNKNVVLRVVHGHIWVQECTLHACAFMGEIDKN